MAPEHGAVEPALLGSLRPSRRHRCRDRGPVGVVYNVDFIIDCLDFMPEVKSARHLPTANQKATKCTLGQHAQEWLQALERSGFKWPGESKKYRGIPRFDMACMLLHRAVFPHSPQRWRYVHGPDASPQHGQDILCVVQSIIDDPTATPLIVSRHQVPLVALGHAHCDLRSKVMAHLYSLFLEFGPD